METFKDRAISLMWGLVDEHQHPHPLYKTTKIKEYEIDEETARAAFILFEQIDTDRCTPEG